VKKLVLAVIALMGTTTAPAFAQRGTVPVSRLNMGAVPHVERDGVREVQMLLKQKDFDPGPLDGVAGALTAGAVRGFQARFAIATSGAIDNQTLFALGAVELAGAASN
jgi:peptidoglycan hydrolase-like protein with peptidoglycan-binding domain